MSWDEYASHYHQYVISPFSPLVRFRLASDIRRLTKIRSTTGESAARVVFDCGSGIGDALVLLAGRASLVVGFDLSGAMLRVSRERLRSTGVRCEQIQSVRTLQALCRAAFRQGENEDKRVVLMQRDIARLQPLADTADLVLAINAIAPETSKRAKAMFSSIAKTLVPGGTLLAVFPAYDALEFLFALARKRGRPMEKLGTIDDGLFFNSSGDRQKFFTPDEITDMCRQERMEIHLLEKLRYPWNVAKRHGWGYFPNAPRIWDWYLSARKMA